MSRFKRFFSGAYPLAYILYRLNKKIGFKSKILKKIYWLIVAKKNIGDAQFLKFSTYDGYNQTVHPSICIQNGEEIMAITPFPYGNDFFENPMLFINNDNCFKAINKNPLFYPEKSKNLTYLSDPNIFIYNKEIKLIFRECVYNDHNKYTSNIYEASFFNNKWSKKRLLLCDNNGLMSPSYIKIFEEEFIYFVVFYEKNTKLIRYDYLKMSKKSDMNVYGIPKGYFLWHIDILFNKYSNEYYGLFTLSTDFVGSCSKLYIFKSTDGINWYNFKEVIIKDNKNKIERMYKATGYFRDEFTLKLYISLRRMDRFWGTYVINDYKI